MNKIDFKGTFKNMQTSIKKRSPEITLGLGIAGMLTSVVVASHATLKAEKIIGEREIIFKHDVVSEGGGKTIYILDAAKLTWKCYISTVLLCSVSTACLIESNSIHSKRNAALAAAYNLSSTALTEYKNKVVEKIGEKKERTIREDILGDKVEKNPPEMCDIFETNKGQTLFYEPLSGRYFKSNIDDVRAAENRLNNKLFNESYISLNDVNLEIGLPSNDLGEDVGWKADDGLVFDLTFTSKLTNNDIGCAVIFYTREPNINFDDSI